ncbi:flagellar biosynthetic protein FliR [Oscillospiraceae bacterium MB08-C2-2]|nr:flagellar biosynthetic protein FliR [Oscillospiraceae bacterium MB08-C2-2]
MNINLDLVLLFVLITIRMLGMFVFSPIFGRTNVPTMVTAGASFFLGLLLVNVVAMPNLGDPNLLEFFLLVVKELAVGLLAGFVLRMFLSVLIVGGEILDMQIGVSMSKVFDPSSNSSVSLSATMLNILFILGFFTSNSHLTLIHMTALTFRVIPIGITGINWEVGQYLAELLSTVLLFAIQLCMPMVVLEVIVTMAVGIMMRVVPQINVFVVNIQLKLLVGFYSMIFLVPAFSAFIENMMAVCMEKIQLAWGYLA